MRRGRGLVTVMLIVTLLTAGGVQTAVRSRHEELEPRQTESRLSGIDTFTLGLILGGLRGPLVLILWTSSESQKIDRNMEDIDTKLNLITKLQPEFDSVLLYQMWNKAYNLSVMMTSLPNKYSCILGALKLGKDAYEARRNSVNVLAAMADIYFNKLGDSTEKEEYIRYMRRDTLPHRVTPPSSPNADPREHEILLDSKGMILPKFLEPRGSLKGQSAGGPDAYNGAELQYLARYGTPEMGGFPYGMTPKALGFNYYRRANQIMIETGQEHLQLSNAVINSRGAIALRKWCEEEMERGRRLEQATMLSPEQLGKAPDIDSATAKMPLRGSFAEAGATELARINEAMFSYRRAAQVGKHAEEEYRRHMANPKYLSNSYQYGSHVETVQALAAMGEGDHDYLKAKAALAGMKTDGGEANVAELVKSARAHYREAWRLYYLLALKYYVEDTLALKIYTQVAGHRVGKATVENENPDLYPQMLALVEQYYDALHQKDPRQVNPSEEDISEYRSCYTRAEERMKLLDAFAGEATTRPAR